jgi:hypothetical protein
MNKYQQKAIKYKEINGREYPKGSIVRICTLTEREAAVLNSETEESGFEYVLVNDEPKELTEKEIRVKLFKTAAEKGLTVAKNIKTDELIKLIEG